MIDRDKLKAMAIARMRKDCAASLPPAQSAAEPAQPPAAPPLPPAPPAHATPPRRTRRPRTKRVIPAPAPADDSFLPHGPGHKKYIRLTNANRSYDYRISCPRDYDPQAPIVFIGVKDGDQAEYIGLIRPPGSFMWGRKSKLSASDPRVIMFDEFYHFLRHTGEPPSSLVFETIN